MSIRVAAVNIHHLAFFILQNYLLTPQLQSDHSIISSATSFINILKVIFQIIVKWWTTDFTVEKLTRVNIKLCFSNFCRKISPHNCFSFLCKWTDFIFFPLIFIKSKVPFFLNNYMSYINRLNGFYFKLNFHSFYEK